MVIKRKKALNAVSLIIASIALLLFFVVSLMGLFSDRSLLEKIAFFIFLTISVFGLRAGFLSLNKFFSSAPEFELTNNELLIYDNTFYNKIPFADMMDCKLYYPPRSSGIIGIFLKPESRIKGNSTIIKDMVFRIPKETKVVYLILEFADINHNQLVEAMRSKIENSKIKET